ncbi:hypothetical protein [Azospirillum sp. sgz302134]
MTGTTTPTPGNAAQDIPMDVEALLARFEAYRPPPAPGPTPFWPPRVRPARWRGNRRDVATDAIHYDRAEIAALLALLDRQGVGRGRVLLSDFYSGLTTLFWGMRFDEVFTISVRDHGEPVLSDGRHTIFFGRVGDMPFLHGMAARTGVLDALLIDGTVRYDLVMILYYTFRPLVRDGGLVVFFHTEDGHTEDGHTEDGHTKDGHTKDGGDPSGGVPRFLAGLRSGDIDGIAHAVENLGIPGGLGIAYERIVA